MSGEAGALARSRRILRKSRRGRSRPHRTPGWAWASANCISTKPKLPPRVSSGYSRKSPSIQTALFGKAVTLQLQWNFDDAARIYQSLLADNPKSEECLVNMVTIGMARKDQAMIADYSAALLTLRPNSQTALEGLATSAFASNDYEAARHYCEKLVEYTPDNFDRWFNLGVAYQKTGKLEEAAKAYSEATRVRPDAKQAYVNLGVVHQESGDLAAARTAYEKCSRDRAGPGRRPAQSRLGSRQAGRQRRSRKGLREAARPQSGSGRRMVPSGLSAPGKKRLSGRQRSLPDLRPEAPGLAGSAPEFGNRLLERGRCRKAPPGPSK